MPTHSPTYPMFCCSKFAKLKCHKKIQVFKHVTPFREVKLPTFSRIIVTSSSNMGIHSYLPAIITHSALPDPENEVTMML
jgi:hypothetical protein